jgi:small-conductance mechanosensitive channel/CRP-like cAMP-binding protein
MPDLDPYPLWHLVAGLAMAGVAVAAMAVVRNRFMRRRLLFTLVLAVAYVVVHLLRVGLGEATGLAGFHALESFGGGLETLLASLAFINLLVTLVFNPWFRDGSSDRAPSIVQDAIVIALFGSVALYLFRDNYHALASSAIAAAAVGLALQDTLANLFAGVGIQIERPFRVGQWIAVGSHEGVVTAVTWRATKIRTKLGNMVILPNNLIAKEAITNYSEPMVPTRLIVDVGADSEVPPNEVRAALMAVLTQARHVLETPPPEVLLYEFGASATTYRTRFWIMDFNLDEEAKDSVRRGIYYEFKRRGIEIPWPIQVRYNREEPPHDTPERRAEFARSIAKVPVLAPLASEAHEALAGAAEERLYGDGEVIVREGDAGASMFIVESGHVAITVGPERREVARITAGGYFGEMSLLTGAPRSATVTATGDCVVLEISAETFGTYVHSHPEVVEPLAAAADARRRELDKTRASAQAERGPEAVSLAHRIREFFGLR